jgi:FKBP-type peptidyl-prolyl cis-trans isomerase
MTMNSFTRAALSALIVPALAFPSTSLFAAKPTAVTLKAPVLTCTAQAVNGLTYTILKAGKGAKPGADAKVKVNYTGRLRSDGTQFDAGQGSDFKVQGVVPGFGQGLQLMQPGGSYRLCIPAALAYGAAGAGSIAPNSDLVFDVDLLSFTTPQPKPIIPVADRTCDKTSASGLGYTAINAGTGPSPTDKDMALIDFLTFDSITGVVETRREWERIPLSQATAMFGEGLRMMQVGASYRFCMPVKDKTLGAPVVNIRVDMIAIRAAPVED